jgi:hypothetical protein
MLMYIHSADSQTASVLTKSTADDQTVMLMIKLLIISVNADQGFLNADVHSQR